MVTAFVASVLIIFGFVDHFDVAMQTLSIVFVCARRYRLRSGCRRDWDVEIRRLNADLLKRPTFVYLIPLIFLFSVTELYGIAIILYAIVP